MTTLLLATVGGAGVQAGVAPVPGRRKMFSFSLLLSMYSASNRVFVISTAEAVEASSVFFCSVSLTDYYPGLKFHRGHKGSGLHCRRSWLQCPSERFP